MKKTTIYGIIGIIIAIIVIVASVSIFVTTKKTTATPSEITIGTLYSSTGSFSVVSTEEYDGLLLWAHQVNSHGGIYVSSLGEKLKVKIISYDDASNPSTAATLYSELITVNHVDFLVADFGSVLTAPAVSIAEEHHVLLFDVTGSSAKFFKTPSPYIVMTSIPSTDYFAKYGAPQLLSLNITKVAVAYAENDFTGPLAQFFVSSLKAHGVTPVYFKGFSTSESDFSSLITKIASLNPQAVVFYGYPTDDIPFLNQLHSMGIHFPYLFTLYPGLLFSAMKSAVGTNMTYSFTYAFPPLVAYKNNYGLSLATLKKIWSSSYPSVPFAYNSIAGYNAGLIIQKAIETAGTLNTKAVRNAVNSFSGSLVTVSGIFAVNATTGMQIGESPPVGQVVPNGSGGLKVIIVFPTSIATGTPIYPAP